MERLQYFDAVELIPNSDSRRSFRIHIKEQVVYIFNHLKNEMINQSKLEIIFPQPHPYLVDSMFFYKDYLNLLSGKHHVRTDHSKLIKSFYIGKYIYSYAYDWTKRIFMFKVLHFQFKLPLHIEATLCIKNRIYFFKENQFYVSKLNPNSTSFKSIKRKSIRPKCENKCNVPRFTTSGPYEILNKFLTNCSRVFKREFNGYDEVDNFKFLLFNESHIESFKDDPDDSANSSISFTSIFLMALGVLIFIILFVGVFIFLEFLSSKSRSYFRNSIKRKSKGVILKGGFFKKKKLLKNNFSANCLPSLID